MSAEKNQVQTLPGLMWPGLTTVGTLIIKVDKQDFNIQSKPVEFANKTFVPKQEAHITVFGSSLGTEILQQFAQQPEKERAVRQAFESTDWSYKKTTDLRHLVRKRSLAPSLDVEQESIIMLVVMDGMELFYNKLRSLDLIADDYPVPPPHVTLYTRNCDQGIGVHSEDELTALTKEHLQKLV
ncbi:MAG: hypothetical protein WBO73_18510 [Gammaproteobacteria bacterium]|jgi:hypothetical protein